MWNFRTSEKGFTLIELLIVVAIIGILAAIAVPQYLNARNDARNKATISSATGAIGELTLEMDYLLRNVDATPSATAILNLIGGNATTLVDAANQIIRGAYPGHATEFNPDGAAVFANSGTARWTVVLATNGTIAADLSPYIFDGTNSVVATGFPKTARVD